MKETHLRRSMEEKRQTQEEMRQRKRNINKIHENGEINISNDYTN